MHFRVQAFFMSGLFALLFSSAAQAEDIACERLASWKGTASGRTAQGNYGRVASNITANFRTNRWTGHMDDVDKNFDVGLAVDSCTADQLSFSVKGAGSIPSSTCTLDAPWTTGARVTGRCVIPGYDDRELDGELIYRR